MRALPLLLLLISACPEGPATRPDAALPGDGLSLSEAGLAICRSPGEPCLPADPCGLNPRCGADLLCRAEGRRSCDDGVACTEDRCVLGGCQRSIAAGSCLIDDRCYPKGAEQDCGSCDPAASQVAWTPRTGPSCDDRNLCTSGDTCQQGICVGHFYSCNDGLACTVDLCDGKGGCQHLLKEGCLIEQTCYGAKQTDPTGCLSCDPSFSTSKWTARTMICTIEGACYGAGARDPTGCHECDPVHAPTRWSTVTEVCQIGGGCIAAGTVHLSGCALCVPGKDPGTWSPLPGGALSSSSFDAGLGGWKLTSPVAGVGWGLSKARSQSSPYSLYYGDPATKSYRTGTAPNAGTATAPTLTLPLQQKAFLGLQLYLDVENANNFDVLTVLVNGKPQWMKASTTVAPADYRRWFPVLLDLSAFAGQEITIALSFETKDGLGNAGEGVYVDDLTVFMGCGSIF